MILCEKSEPKFLDNLQINGDTGLVENISWQQDWPNFRTEFLIKELCDNFNIICHKQIVLFHFCHFFKKFDSIIIIDDPISSYTVDFDSVCVVTLALIIVIVILFLAKKIAEIIVVNVRDLRRFNSYDFYVFFAF